MAAHRGGARPSSTRSTSAASPTATATGSATCPASGLALPYLRRLGIDAVWLNPFYPSPQADAGYDVADYRDVDPRFGTLADADGLIADAHALGIRVIFDIVPNHTSDEHAWFRAALAAGPGSPERARYLFRDGRGKGGSEPPNDWDEHLRRPGVDAGDRGRWPARAVVPPPVRPQAARPRLDATRRSTRSSSSILRFWFDRGVDGFRIDVAHGLAKDPELPDLAGRFPSGGPADAAHPHWDVDAVHDVYREWRRVSDAYDGDRAFVGEVWVATPERLARYLRPDELHTAFNFDFLLGAVGRGRAARGDRPEHRRARRGRRAGDVGAVEPRRRCATSRATAAATSAGAGPGRRRC